MSEQERLRQLRDRYSDAVDMALSIGETLPEYEMDVADVNFLFQQAERVQELRKLRETVAKAHQSNLEKAADENARLREALEFYADRVIYKPRTRPIYGPFGYAVYHILEDYGAIARHALKGESE